MDSAIRARSADAIFLPKVRRLLVLLAGVPGLLALAPTAAQALISMNHTEPVRRAS
jgi:hypothetical protein